MREILFKAKRVDNGEWVEGDLLQVIYPSGKPTMYSIMEQSPLATNYPVIAETVCQFTGVCDNNGKKIWENDIIFDTYYEKLGVVKFGMGTFDSGVYRYYGWHYESEGNVDHHELYKFDGIVDFEVLGNIFDNPELLTAERIGDNEN
jgi:uncharacterized phage protein (TIGR01671 family)